jgi:glucosamine--fructose-6-phosphate aminotransferase (isomerizing)
MLEEAGCAGDVAARFLDANAGTLDALAASLHSAPPPVIVTCARGSSDHAATYGKYLFETLLGIPVASGALSIASVYHTAVKTPGLCIAISQSGRSPDLLASVEAQKRAGSRIVALVNDITSPLAALADTLLPLHAGPERSVAATKSYIASLVGLAAMAGRWSGDAALNEAILTLPTLLRRAFQLDWSPAIGVLGNATNLYVLGRSYSMGIAQEAALKLKETCGLHAEAFSAAEVRHGPMAIVGEGFPALGFATSDQAGDSVRQTVADFATRGARIALADAGGVSLPAIKAHPAIEPILMIQSFYRLAHDLSLHRGLNPDNPPYLSKVTSTL